MSNQNGTSRTQIESQEVVKERIIGRDTRAYINAFVVLTIWLAADLHKPINVKFLGRMLGAWAGFGLS